MHKTKTLTIYFTELLTRLTAVTQLKHRAWFLGQNFHLAEMLPTSLSANEIPELLLLNWKSQKEEKLVLWL
jgi:hypothetical protein